MGTEKTLKDLLPISLGAVAFVITVLFSFSIFKFLEKAEEEKQYSSMVTIAEQTNADIYANLMRNLSKVFSLSALANDDGSITPQMERQLAGMIKDSQIHSFIFARDGVVSSAFPSEINQLVGRNFIQDFSRHINTSPLMNDTEPYLIGPYKSSLGDYELITIALPVYKIDNNGKRIWWGIVAVAVDYSKLMENMDFSDVNKRGFACKIWRFNTITNKEQIICQTEIPLADKIKKNRVTFQKRYFQDGWNYTLEPIKQTLKFYFYLLGSIFLILDILEAFVIYYIVRSFQNRQQQKMFKMQSKLVKMQEHTIISLSSLVENRDSDTGEHVRRTSDYVYMLAKEAQKRGVYADVLTDNYIQLLRSAAPMHDIGKIVVPDAVLKKPGRLTPEEFIEIRKHTVEGGRIIQDVIGPVQTPEYVHIAREIAVYHHEKWDGTGYPYGLAKEDIPISARIMALADVFDALTTPRCYKEPFSFEQAMKIITMESRFQFDPSLVEVFADCENQLKEILNKSRL